MKKAIVFLSTICLIVMGAFTLSSWTNHSDDSSNLQEQYDCKACKGQGHDLDSKCSSCGGKGWIPTCEPCTAYGCNKGYTKDRYGDTVPCMVCSGKGYVEGRTNCTACAGWGHPYCKKCGGSGKVERND